MATTSSKTLPIPSPTIGANLTAGDMQAYLGQSVLQWCGKYGGIGDNKLEKEHHKNHCAHFVSHVLQIRIPGAALCSNVNDTKYSNKDQMLGFCIRVNEVFNSCKGRAHLGKKEIPTGSCLIIATIQKNITDEKALTIGNNKLKHIGIYIGGKVYNYSNDASKVVAKDLAQFRHHYGAHTILLRADFP